MSKITSSSPLMVRLDESSKALLSQAAGLRKVSISDYVRMITLAQAKREVAAAQDQLIVLSPDEQLAFWTALQTTPKLTPAQKKLGAVMRGER